MSLIAIHIGISPCQEVKTEVCVNSWVLCKMQTEQSVVEI